MKGLESIILNPDFQLEGFLLPRFLGGDRAREEDECSFQFFVEKKGILPSVVDHGQEFIFPAQLYGDSLNGFEIRAVEEFPLDGGKEKDRSFE